MNSSEIVIHVRGGVVRDVFSSDADADVIVVDSDCTPHHENSVIVATNDRQRLASVSRLQPQPLRMLAGTEIEASIEACEQDLLFIPAF